MQKVALPKHRIYQPSYLLTFKHDDHDHNLHCQVAVLIPLSMYYSHAPWYDRHSRLCPRPQLHLLTRGHWLLVLDASYEMRQASRLLVSVRTSTKVKAQRTVRHVNTRILLRTSPTTIQGRVAQDGYHTVATIKYDTVVLGRAPRGGGGGGGRGGPVGNKTIAKIKYRSGVLAPPPHWHGMIDYNHVEQKGSTTANSLLVSRISFPLPRSRDDPIDHVELNKAKHLSCSQTLFVACLTADLRVR